MYDYLKFGETYRADRVTHSPKIDLETGELLVSNVVKEEEQGNP